MRVIEIVPYKPVWPDEFQRIGAELRAGLGDLALRVDHIGSTSVPGLGAKDVIDVQVTVTALEPVEPFVDAFTAIGYRFRPDNRDDHRPFGDTAPPEHWKKLYFREPEGGRRVHVHVRAAGYANQRYALLFRDFLRQHPLAVAHYERLKRELARLHPHDIDAYLAVKEPAFGLIMLAAEEWANRTAWKPGPSDA